MYSGIYSPNRILKVSLVRKCISRGWVEKNQRRDSFLLLIIGPSVSFGSAVTQKLRRLTKNCSDSERRVSPEVQSDVGVSTVLGVDLAWVSVVRLVSENRSCTELDSRWLLFLLCTPNEDTFSCLYPSVNRCGICLQIGAPVGLHAMSETIVGSIKMRCFFFVVGLWLCCCVGSREVTS